MNKEAIQTFIQKRMRKCIVGHEDPAFADECRSLGFEMDCGKSLEAAFPDKQCFCETENWRTAVELITDPIQLGTAIFSQWRYYTHWAGTGTEWNGEWFRIAFKRLSRLIEEAS